MIKNMKSVWEQILPSSNPSLRLLRLIAFVCQIASPNSVRFLLVSKYLIFSPPFITKSFTSVPYLLVATHVQLPCWYNLLLVVFVVFINTVKFRINAMYMGRFPVAEHGTWLPGFTLTAVSTIFGGTGEVMLEFSQYCNIYLLYFLVSTRAVIGQFSGPYFPVRPAII